MFADIVLSLVSGGFIGIVVGFGLGRHSVQGRFHPNRSIKAARHSQDEEPNDLLLTRFECEGIAIAQANQRRAYDSAGFPIDANGRCVEIKRDWVGDYWL